MTPSPILRLLLATSLAVSWSAPVSADSSPDAQQWLDKLISVYDRGPFRVDYQAELDMSGLGQPLTGTLKGNVIQADRSHSRIQLALDMSAVPGAPTGATSISMLIVTDGTTVWTEMNNPAAGGRQVTKAALADLEKLGESMGGISPTSMDPVAQLETLTQTMDFEVVGEAGGAVTLHGKITAETRDRLGMLAAPGVDGFVFVLDAKTGFPTAVRADGEIPFVTMHFHNLKFVEAASLAPGLFTYSPPEGVPVIDLGAMLQSQMPAAQSQ